MAGISQGDESGTPTECNGRRDSKSRRVQGSEAGEDSDSAWQEDACRRDDIDISNIITPEDLQALLQQPKSRLMIEESPTLQAGTAMELYIRKQGKLDELKGTEKLARHPCGQLRPRSFARRLVLEVLVSWKAYRDELKHHRLRAPGGSQLGSQNGSRRGSIMSQGLDMSAPSPRGPSITTLPEICGPGAGRPRRGALMEAAMKNTQAAEEAALGFAKAEKGKSKEDCRGGAMSDQSSPTAGATPRRSSGNRSKRGGNRGSPATSPRSKAFAAFQSDRLNRGRQEKAQRQRLLDDTMYVSDQLDKLRRGKVMLQDAVSVADKSTLFENRCLFSSYARDITRKKMKDVGETGTLSLPSLHTSGRLQASTEFCRHANAEPLLSGSLKKKKGQQEEKPSNIAMQVRDLQHIITNSNPALKPKSEDEEKSKKPQARASVFKALGASLKLGKD
eukprot:TRINITY_DN48958_c0_g1_i1.p1 TRINITY_DN48958_c0_g1~~TRINITY_DN48958_c0_g1_i1.p1  ORF type:complete len:448 (-),score=86.99 TRINITY_DN48958_c0_g1_i1:63-1406(-)